jgi:hypothetical protein
MKLSKIRFFGSLLGSFLLCGSALADDGGGISTSLTHGKGFPCPSPNTWTMVNGVAICSNTTTTTGDSSVTSSAATQSIGPAGEIRWIDYDTTADEALKPYTTAATSVSVSEYDAKMFAAVTTTLTNTSTSATVTVTTAPTLGTAVTASDVAQFAIASNTCTAGLVLKAGASCSAVVNRIGTSTAENCKSYGAHLIFTTSVATAYIILDKTYLSSACSSSSGSKTTIK